MKKRLILFWMILLPFLAAAQLQLPGTPAGRRFLQNITPPVVRLKMPPLPKQQITGTNRAPQPLRAGTVLPVTSHLLQRGTWEKLPDGRFVWRLKMEVEGATALNLYFKNIHLGPNDRLYLYNARKGQLRGAFTRQNNGKEMGTTYLLGNSITLELDAPEKYDTLPFEVTSVGNLTEYPEKTLKDFGDAGSCEIPVNCPESNRFKSQKNSVARILLRDGGTLYWCTGSLINDTRNDGTPYFLTANHCGDGSTTA
ncbi:MAG TPA: hypothetical protein ENJ69_00740, partial [Bacteroidetes bacterium]|nr:hypothetical protein [Bacteroidota bacterium]